MLLSSAAKVGIIALLALLAFGAVAWFLLGERLTGYNLVVVYEDALGLTEGSSVNMAGVRIGSVDSIMLSENQLAMVTLRIKPQHQIPKDSEFLLKSGLLIGDRQIDVVPNRQAREFLRPGAVVTGKVSTRLEDVIPDARQLVANLREISESLKKLMADDTIYRSIDRSLANIENATSSLSRTMLLLQGTVSSERDQVHAIVANVALASENVRTLTEHIQQAVKAGRFDEKLIQTLETSQRTVESLERTAASLEKLTTDPALQQDIRETVSGTRAAVEEARAAIAEAREAVGRVGGVFGGGVRRPRLSVEEVLVDSLYIPDEDKLRATLTANFPTGRESFLALGLYDIGAKNKVILQPGQMLDEQTRLRYGIWASSLGVGLDRNVSPRVFGSLNLYDPNDPRLDLHAGYRLSPNAGLLLGVDRLLDENRLTFGFRLSR